MTNATGNHRIFDNQSPDKRLSEALRQTFSAYQRIDVATGYFALRGWAELDPLIRESYETGDCDGPIARILVGMIMPAQHEAMIDALQAQVSQSENDTTSLGEKAGLVRDQLVVHLRNQLATGVPTKTDRQTLQSLRELLELKAVEVRVYTRQPLHGKTYLLHHENAIIPSAGFVGSSNLTGAGLNGNLELNLKATDQAASDELSEWFNHLWDDRFTMNIDAELLDLVDESWASPIPRSPYDVFMKVCHTMSRDVRAGLAQYEISPLIASTLLGFQATAVKTLSRRIMQRRGTMLGDVVGLGKTLTAIAVALMLRDNHGFQPLVICPKNLQSMWEEHMRKYDLTGRVVPYSMVHKVLPELPRYRFVIVDESHTLRNEGTRIYDSVQKYLHENEAHVLLLTATPYNLKYADVANQLALFLDEDEDLGLTPTFALERNPNLYNNLEVAHSTLAAFRRSEESEDWKRLMGEHLVRRTRSFVMNNYAKTNDEGRKYLQFQNPDGTPAGRFTFPTRRVVPLDHSFDENDPAHKMSADETLDALARLHLPRYDLTRYLSPDARRLASKGDRAFIDDFIAARGQVSGFVRTNFYKRLSSCGHSFILSLQRHLRRNELFIYALRNNLKLPAGTLDPATLADDEIDLDASLYGANVDDDFFSEIAADYASLEALAPRGVRWVNPALFSSDLLEQLEDDSRTIRGLLKSYGHWDIAHDSKLTKLLELIRDTHPGEKILVFTEYKDTALYLERALTELGIEGVAAATGASADATDLARRFSPDTNKEGTEIDPEDEIRILIATDVLSEGQNLQQAHIIANYDLPWAIIKLIQRAGRVDRIGQRSDVVLLYTMVHGQVEEQLNLRRRIQQRLAANAATFGSDEKFFGTDTETRTISDLYDGELQDVPATEEVDAGSLAFEIWESATKSDPTLRNRIEKLPDLIDATRRWEPARSGELEGIICCASTESGIDSFAVADQTGRRRLLTGHEALTVLRCSPETEPLPLRNDHDESVKELIQEVISRNLNTSGRLRGERKIIWNRVGQTLEARTNQRYSAALDALYNFPLTTIAINQLRSKRRRSATDTDLLELIADLHEQKLLTATSSKTADTIRIVASMGISK
ncbi:helicase-related protein [Corynebacterium xerosis]|uniref:helicase-related protein n=1 Tax=Corynebacterium xerosis TaxID=1725 RepID=UPI001F08FF63|nr:helicase-related protein [Corynebacterium xerosis]